MQISALLPLMFAEDVEHGVRDLLGEEAVHHLGHHRFVTFDAVGDTVSER